MNSRKILASAIVGMLIIGGLGFITVGEMPREHDVLSTPEPIQPRGTVPRVALAEDFTGWNCGPCTSHNPQWNAALATVGYNVAAPANIHVWWPTSNNDPMYQYCEGITAPGGDDNSVTDRVQFYGVGWVPWANIEGVSVATGGTQASYQTQFTNAAAIPARVEITTSGYINYGALTATINIRAEAVDPLPAGDYRLMTYLWENPADNMGSGTNGETSFPWAVWDMIPNGQGTAIWSTGAQIGDYYEISYTRPIESAWDSEIGATVFVQNFGTKYVENAHVETFQNPEVTLVSPGRATPEQEFSGLVSIDWDARDTQDGTVLSIALDYSTNGGSAWTNIATGLPNSPPYAWNTASVADSPNYIVRVTATDSGSNTGSGKFSTSMEYFSVDNILSDRWYLQKENENLAGNLDLDMKPFENLEWDEWNRVLAPGETFVDITGAGEFVIQSFASDPLDDAYEVGGAWTFSVSAKTGYSTPVPNGNLYARIYAHNGVSSRLLGTTAYDDESIGSFSSYHTFSWIHTLSSAYVYEGERIIAEIMLHSTSGTSTALFLNTARSDIKVMGTITNDFQSTFVSDNVDETIAEITNYQTRYIDQPFTSSTFPPTGWQVAVSGTTGTWSRQDTNSAGGIRPEARFVFGASGTGTSRLYTGPVDTSGQTSLDLAFNTFFDDYGTGVTVKVQTSTNGATWVDTGWQRTGGSGNYGPIRATEVLTTADNIGSATLYVAFVVDGNSYQLDYWFVDDIVLGRDLTSMLEHKWTTYVPTGDSPYQFNLEASRVAGTDNDNFQFAYSTDDSTYTNMALVNSATDTTYTYSLPAGLTSPVYIRVQDTVRTAGATAISQVDVDRMYISSTAPSQMILGYDHYSASSYVVPYLGAVPDNKPVVTISSPASGTADQVISGSPFAVTWTATDVEDAANTLDIKIEYSANGGSSWTTLEDGTNNNDGAYSWNTAGLPDDVNYMLRITARDSFPHSGYDVSDYPFSIDNTINDRWYLQVQTTGPNYRLNMMPVDVGPNTKPTATITGIGQYIIGTWQTDALIGTSIAGAWTFNIFGKATSSSGAATLYAKIYATSGPTLLDTTVSDNENVFSYTASHMFTWTDTLAGTFTSGDSLYVEIWADVTSSPTTVTLTTAGTTAAGGPHNVWWCDVNDNSQAELTTPGGGSGAVEFTDAYYTAASTSNDVRAGPSINPGANDEIFVKNSFATTVTPADVSGIAFTYEGQYSAASTVVTIYAWNYATSLWVAVGTTMTFTTAATDYTMTRSITSGFSNYISGGIILWGAYGSLRATCSVDFMQVQLTLVPATIETHFDFLGAQSYIVPTISGGIPATPYNINLAGKTANSWVYVSFPYQFSGNIQDVLNDATFGDGGTLWTVARWYNPQTPADPWKVYRVGGTANDLTTITNAMGVWLWITANGGDQMLTTGLTGDYSATAVVISLYAGWNMVGYPTATSRAESATLPAEADLVASWQAASPYITQHAKGATMMVEGNAYWVHVTTDCTWTVQP